ncbi:Universal stress protein family protein [Pseudomonas delhiensis]|uniref:Universal stress protein family protein n=1 Tax=Pseudomonas delhiensis TaxID=366289 RepID=A0A239KJA9_9PSED|nr:universal stress protein [Pseudomonas delhiensis]SDJ16287.1 Universal stress protein family protein [Pseudomonas delhiensis]SNT18241.1 Universal stress protein family protein [Pseudomonas delhiensis]
MTEIWAQAALWLGLALLATLVSIFLRIATALSEIVVGTIAQLILGALLGSVARQVIDHAPCAVTVIRG